MEYERASVDISGVGGAVKRVARCVTRDRGDVTFGNHVDEGAFSTASLAEEYDVREWHQW